MSTTSKLGADMTDEQILSEFERRAFSPLRMADGTPTLDAIRLIEGVRALLARQPAAIDKEAVTLDHVKALESAVCNGQSGEALRLLHHMRNALAAPPANEASKPAPSVEQDERGAFYRKALYQIAYWLDGGQEQIQKFALSVLDGEPATIGELDPHDALRYMACREAAIERGLFATPEEYDAMVEDSLRKKGKEVLTGRGHNYGKKVAKDGSLYRPAACELSDEQADTLKLAIGYIGSSTRDDRHEHIARIRDLLQSHQARAASTSAKDVQDKRGALTDEQIVEALLDTLVFKLHANNDQVRRFRDAFHFASACDAMLVDVEEVKQLCRDFSSRTGNVYIKDVESALDGIVVRAASTSANVAQGWKLVPIVPTDDMEIAAENDYEDTGATFPDWKSAYRAMLAAAPTLPSANVAQGAEAIKSAYRKGFMAGWNGEGEAISAPQSAPPAQTAFTEAQLADIRRAAVVIRENSYPCPDKPHSNWALADRIEKVIAALTAAQSASGDKS